MYWLIAHIVPMRPGGYQMPSVLTEKVITTLETAMVHSISDRIAEDYVKALNESFEAGNNEGDDLVGVVCDVMVRRLSTSSNPILASDILVKCYVIAIQIGGDIETEVCAQLRLVTVKVANASEEVMSALLGHPNGIGGGLAQLAKQGGAIRRSFP